MRIGECDSELTALNAEALLAEGAGAKAAAEAMKLVAMANFIFSMLIILDLNCEIIYIFPTGHGY